MTSSTSLHEEVIIDHDEMNCESMDIQQENPSRGQVLLQNALVELQKLRALTQQQKTELAEARKQIAENDENCIKLGEFTYGEDKATMQLSKYCSIVVNTHNDRAFCHFFGPPKKDAKGHVIKKEYFCIMKNEFDVLNINFHKVKEEFLKAHHKMGKN